MAVAPVYYRPKSFTLTDQYYKESIEAVATFNTRICLERKGRLPFIDSQTGLAQNSSSLWNPYRYRNKGVAPGQLYTYPAKRWKKKRRFFNFDYNSSRNDVESGDADMHQISAVENPAAVETPSVIESSETSKDKWYDDLDVLSEPPDAGEIDDRNSDSSDYEETYIKRRKKKKAAPKRGSRKKAAKTVDVDLGDYEDKEKPYGCDICGARYKTRPGLTYHMTHSHASGEEAEEDVSIQMPLSKAPTPTGSTRGESSSGRGTRSSVRNTGGASNSQTGPTNSYCDFCLGDETENKKTGGREELVSCADCGRSGHPTCLQFTANMIISVKKYPWQCIECKSCGLCGTSDNDEQLLFCDDCDRGYHMYCLNPPLSEPPEGSWSCHLCIVEFYGGKKPEGMQ